MALLPGAARRRGTDPRLVGADSSRGEARCESSLYVRTGKEWRTRDLRVQAHVRAGCQVAATHGVLKDRGENAGTTVKQLLKSLCCCCLCYLMLTGHFAYHSDFEAACCPEPARAALDCAQLVRAACTPPAIYPILLIFCP